MGLIGFRQMIARWAFAMPEGERPESKEPDRKADAKDGNHSVHENPTERKEETKWIRQ